MVLTRVQAAIIDLIQTGFKNLGLEVQGFRAYSLEFLFGVQGFLGVAGPGV